jgi:hypothetical protein
MNRSLAILKVANIMASCLKGDCDNEIATHAILHISMKSGIDTDELIDAAHVMIQAEIELNKAS